MTHRNDADRRAQRTRTELHGALASLVHEKPYDDIVVKEILARADVARSTFYAHYRGKDDLLAHAMRDLLRIGRPSASPWSAVSDRLLRFSLPFLVHVERWREHDRLPMDADGAATVHEHLRRVLECALTEELRAEHRRRPGTGDAHFPAELLARHVAATFVLTLEWWLAHPTLSAREIDGRFRALTEPTLRACLGG